MFAHASIGDGQDLAFSVLASLPTISYAVGEERKTTCASVAAHNQLCCWGLIPVAFKLVSWLEHVSSRG